MYRGSLSVAKTVCRGHVRTAGLVPSSASPFHVRPVPDNDAIAPSGPDRKPETGNGTRYYCLDTEPTPRLVAADFRQDAPAGQRPAPNETADAAASRGDNRAAEAMPTPGTVPAGAGIALYDDRGYISSRGETRGRGVHPVGCPRRPLLRETYRVANMAERECECVYLSAACRPGRLCLDAAGRSPGRRQTSQDLRRVTADRTDDDRRGLGQACMETRSGA